jgi:hypothetical protein
LNLLEALRRGVRNLDAGKEDPSAKKPQDDPKWDVISMIKECAVESRRHGRSIVIRSQRPFQS